MHQTLDKKSPEVCLSFAGDLIFVFPKIEPLLLVKVWRGGSTGLSSKLTGSEHV